MSKIATPYVKDGINDYIVHGNEDAVNPRAYRHKSCRALQAHHWRLAKVPSSDCGLTPSDFKGAMRSKISTQIFALRQREADEFYATVIPQDLSPDAQERDAPGICAECSGPSSSITTS